MSEVWKNGSTRQWRKIRASVLERDGHRCQLRIEGKCKTRADCVHHINGKIHGDDPDYLMASCTPCNLAIGDPTKTTSRADPDPTPRTVWA